MKNIFLFLFIGVLPSVVAQKETNTWYFGRFAGISFASGKPVSITDSKLTTEEGSSVISDKEGKMLFYTNGVSVWNAKHEEMEHGVKLNGNPSSTQSSVVIAWPNHPGKYYLFTTAASGAPTGLGYSMIDMSLKAGLGDVVETERNVKINGPVTEKMTAVTHRNGIDTWLIAHLWNSNEFIAYLVTEKGVAKVPVSSKTGAIHQGTAINTQGYMKSSPDGSNLALVLEESDLVEVFDFNNESGVVSQPIAIQAKARSYVYGIEFSPDGSLLYYSAGGVGEIWQVNLQAGSEKAIQSSAVLAGKTARGEWIGALQLASDGKIYFTIYKTSFLGVIETPNYPAANCGYKNDAVALDGRIATLGLPNFAQSFFTQNHAAKVSYFDEKTVTTGKNFVLKGINFDFAKYSLQASSYVELKKLVAVLQKNPAYKVEIMGHTDNIGNKSSNILLSQNRAKAVKEYLVSQQIVAERITFSGYGSGKPIAGNGTEAGRAKNRRVEFRLSK